MLYGCIKCYQDGVGGWGVGVEGVDRNLREIFFVGDVFLSSYLIEEYFQYHNNIVVLKVK